VVPLAPIGVTGPPGPVALIAASCRPAPIICSAGAEPLVRARSLVRVKLNRIELTSY
jgi:hypothetical protein